MATTNETSYVRYLVFQILLNLQATLLLHSDLTTILACETVCLISVRTKGFLKGSFAANLCESVTKSNVKAKKSWTFKEEKHKLWEREVFERFLLWYLEEFFLLRLLRPSTMRWRLIVLKKNSTRTLCCSFNSFQRERVSFTF